VSDPQDRRLLARATLALARANIHYWRNVAPLVRRELKHWETRASAIADPEVRRIALAKLRDERFNAEAGAMLATLAPAAYREDAVLAIVALEVLFDLLDGLSERPCADPLGEGERLFVALTDAIEPRVTNGPSERRERSEDGDGDYLQELSATVCLALGRLPAKAAIVHVARAAAARSAQAQIRMHALPQLGSEQLEEWGSSEAIGTGLGWRELLAGAASSVLAVHALIVAAADWRTTPAQAAQIDAAYLSICVLLTLLDSLVDSEQDLSAGDQGYVSLYEDRELLAQTLVEVAHRALGQARELSDGAHHVMLLNGVVAYYASQPGARSPQARPVIARLRRELATPITPALAVMRTWRAAKRAQERWRPISVANDRES
jgi:tetraprenyl-beta-curcumene synthase